jgi:hypothetical protein
MFCILNKRSGKGIYANVYDGAYGGRNAANGGDTLRRSMRG